MNYPNNYSGRCDHSSGCAASCFGTSDRNYSACTYEAPYGSSCARRCPNAYCSTCIIGFFVVLLALAIGLIFGSVFYETFFPVLASLIIFALVITAIIVSLLICRWRRRPC